LVAVAAKITTVPSALRAKNNPRQAAASAAVSAVRSGNGP
jgi:hypothetical protein